MPKSLRRIPKRPRPTTRQRSLMTPTRGRRFPPQRPPLSGSQPRTRRPPRSGSEPKTRPPQRRHPRHAISRHPSNKRLRPTLTRPAKRSLWPGRWPRILSGSTATASARGHEGAALHHPDFPGMRTGEKSRIIADDQEALSDLDVGSSEIAARRADDARHPQSRSILPERGRPATMNGATAGARARERMASGPSRTSGAILGRASVTKARRGSPRPRNPTRRGSKRGRPRRRASDPAG